MIKTIILIAILIFFKNSFATEAEEPFGPIHPDIISLAEMHPGEIVIKKRDHLMSIGLTNVAEWEESSLTSNFQHHLDGLLRAHRFINRGGGPNRRTMRPIQDPVFFALITAAAVHGYEGALRYISNFGRSDHIYAFCDYLKPKTLRVLESTKTHSPYPSIYLRCDLSNEEIDSLRIFFDKRDLEFHALLGDTSAEQSLIDSFYNAETYLRKRMWAMRLGFVETENTIRVLVETIACSTHSQFGDVVIYLRREILRILSRVFPDEPLFQKVPFRERSDRFYPKEERMEYMEKLNQWAYDNFKIELNLTEENFHLRRSTMEIDPDYVPYYIRQTNQYHRNKSTKCE
ncbi:hypothetical protein QA601_14145 [Chitinispirillales bacterium ANBcel5]|uniref:hypothetical protein n=1 Tax=Cellulosispirillum alkaliphilum TaxID=3039283 RepID=UPI002A583CDC|nr:hypothetical protein [Chitinispirillales bacterium ANBcel5]